MTGFYYCPLLALESILNISVEDSIKSNILSYKRIYQTCDKTNLVTLNTSKW